jgi:hypothetical protein
VVTAFRPNCLAQSGFAEVEPEAVACLRPMVATREVYNPKTRRQFINYDDKVHLRDKPQVGA